MLAGPPDFSQSALTWVLQLLCRSRKVKCHRLPGHDKVRFTSCLTSQAQRISGDSVRYILVPPSIFTFSNHLIITTALFIQKLPLHVRLHRASCCCNSLTHLPGILFNKLQAKRSAALMLVGDLEILVLEV